MKVHVEKISGDNLRPGMLAAGWLIRYNMSNYGWLSTKSVATSEEADEFVQKVRKERSRDIREVLFLMPVQGQGQAVVGEQSGYEWLCRNISGEVSPEEYEDAVKDRRE